MPELLERLRDPGQRKALLRDLAREAANRGDLDAVFAACGYTPHPAQSDFHRCTSPRRVLCTGRRFGKSTACAMEIVARLLAGQDNGRDARSVAIVAPEYDLAGRIADVVDGVLLRQLGFRPAKHVTVADKRCLVMPWGSGYWTGSAKNEDALLGRAWDDVYLDEAARIPPRLWDAVLEPGLLDRGGRATFVSTPLPAGWFSGLWQLCEDPQEAEWVGFRAASAENPHLSRRELDRAKRKTDPRVWRREYLGEFVALEGSVFPEFDRVKHASGPGFDRERLLVWSWDVGASEASPHALIVGQVYDSELHIIDELVRPGISSLQFAREFRAWWRSRGYPLDRVLMACVDGAARDAALTLASELSDSGLMPLRVAALGGMRSFCGLTRWKPDLASSVDLIHEGLSGQSWRLLIDGSRCPTLVSEMGLYTYRGATAAGGPDLGVVKTADHCVDALRYLVANLQRRGVWRMYGEEELRSMRRAAEQQRMATMHLRGGRSR